MSYFNQLPLEELESSIEKYPDEPEIRAALIKRLAADGEVDSAISQAFIAQELMPNDSELAILKAFCLLRVGEFENGHELLQRILRNDPRTELQELIASEIAPIFTTPEVDLQNPDSLMLSLPREELEGEFGERFESMLEIICNMADESNDSVKDLCRHIQRYPEDLSAKLCLANLHIVNNNEPLAIPLYRSVIADDPRAAAAYFDLATIVEPNEAVELTREGLKLCPTHSGGRFNLGLFLLQTGQPDQGRMELARIPADSEHYASALWATAESYELQNDFAQAAKVARRLCALKPHDPSTHGNLGHLLCQMGEHDQAISVFETALEIEPRHLDSLFNLAVAYTCVNRIEEAIEQYEQRNQIESRDVIALNNLGTLYSKNNQLDQAIETLELAHHIDPTNELVCQNLGVFYCMICDFERSLEFSNKAIEMNPANPKAHWNLGCAYAKNGERDLMLECLKTALRINPSMRENLLLDTDLESYWCDKEFLELANSRS